MKLPLIHLTLAILASGAAIQKPGTVSYDGYKVFRVKTKGRPELVTERLSTITYDEWSNANGQHIDISLAPDQIPAFLELGLDHHCMHENLGHSIASESATNTVWKRQIDDLGWYDSYHPFDDHRQYLEDIHAAHPNTSEMVSSGTSVEGRDILGIHLWGADGPGKPAVLWHGTVHAREWITAMVWFPRLVRSISDYPGRSSNISLSTWLLCMKPTK